MSIDFSPEHIADMAPDYITAKAELERENARLWGVLDRLRKATELVNDALYTMTQERDAAQARAERLAEELRDMIELVIAVADPSNISVEQGIKDAFAALAETGSGEDKRKE